MGFSLNKFLSTLFGNKAARDIKEIRPIVEQVLAVEPEIQKLSNDELRAKVDEIKAQLYETRSWNKGLGQGIIDWKRLADLANAQGV